MFQIFAISLHQQVKESPSGARVEVSTLKASPEFFRDFQKMRSMT